jgi:hypothetical protein
MSERIGADEILHRLREAALKADPDAPSRRLAEALDCPKCGAPAQVAMSEVRTH